MARRQTLEQWIREALIHKTEEGDTCSMISLVATYRGAAKEEIHSWKFRNGADQWNPKQLAEQIQDKVNNHAEASNEPVNLYAWAFYGNQASEPESKHKIVAQVEDNFDGWTEPGTPKGIIEQGMRHLEATTRLYLAQMGTMLDASNRQMQVLTDQNIRLQTENADAYQIVRELVQERGNQEHERNMQRLTYERSTEERKKWMSFFPALANTILGREIFPQSTADTALVETIADALSVEDIQKLSGMVPPTLWGPLAARFEKAIKRKQEVEAANRQLTEGGDPLKDAAGD